MLVTGGIYWAQILNETLHTRNLNCSNSIFLLTVAVRRLCLLVGRTLNLITRLISPINFPHCTTVTVPTIALCKSPSDLHQVTCCWSIQSASPALIQISNYGLDITFKQNVYWKIAVLPITSWPGAFLVHHSGSLKLYAVPVDTPRTTDQLALQFPYKSSDASCHESKAYSSSSEGSFWHDSTCLVAGLRCFYAVQSRWHLR